MATSTYILDINDFTDVIDLSPNIATKFVRQYTGITQEKFGRKMLCNETYNELIDQLSQGGESYLTPSYEALLPFLKDYLIYKTMERYYSNGNYKSTPAGMRAHTDTISQGLTPEQMRQLTDQATHDAGFYQDELQNFLENNADDYPLWKESRCNCNNFSTGTGSIRFGKRVSKKTQIKYT